MSPLRSIRRCWQPARPASRRRCAVGSRARQSSLAGIADLHRRGDCRRDRGEPAVAPALAPALAHPWRDRRRWPNGRPASTSVMRKRQEPDVSRRVHCGVSGVRPFSFGHRGSAGVERRAVLPQRSAGWHGFRRAGRRMRKLVVQLDNRIARRVLREIFLGMAPWAQCSLSSLPPRLRHRRPTCQLHLARGGGREGARVRPALGCGGYARRGERSACNGGPRRDAR